MIASRHLSGLIGTLVALLVATALVSEGFAADDSVVLEFSGALLAMADSNATSAPATATPRGRDTNTLTAASAAPVISLLKLPNFASLLEQRRKALRNGTTLVKWRLLFYGIPVYGNLITAKFERSGRFKGKLSGDKGINAAKIDRVPRVAESFAVRAVTESLGLNVSKDPAEFLLKNVHFERILKYDRSASRLKLCYRVSCFVEWTSCWREPLNPVGIVDAMSGKVLSSWNGLHAQKADSVVSGLGGTAANPKSYADVPVSRDGGDKCWYDTAKIKVQNMKSEYSGPFVPESFACSAAANSSYDRVNGGYSALNDVARNAVVVVDMYRQYLGIDGPTGVLPLKARVHYGSRYENAFFDGTYAVFGDGAQTFYPLASLDIVTHEFSHGFTMLTSALEYVGQSGAISESFSDMAAATAVFFDTSSRNYDIGAGITKSGVPIRSMCSPKSDGRSIEHASLYREGTHVHYASGVYNKVFCLLAKSWDLPITFQMFAYANAFYWAQTTNFAYGACGVRTAASDLGLSVADVDAAFAVVGVACPTEKGAVKPPPQPRH